VQISRDFQRLLTLCLCGFTALCLAAPTDMCRTLCANEKEQCVKAIVKSGWLESARLFFENHSSMWRSRNDSTTDATSWLQQRHEKSMSDKTTSNQQKLRCDSQYLQCAQSCTGAAGSMAPQEAASGPYLTPLTPQ
jgi:hypothetical protein